VTDGELRAALNLAQTHPFMGGKKGAANLVHDQAAWIGAGSFDAIKGTLAQQIGEELKSRRSGRVTPEPFQEPVATRLGQVWGTDLFEVMAWDMRFDICDFLDIFNQEYLALRAPSTPPTAPLWLLASSSPAPNRVAAPPTCARRATAAPSTMATFRRR